MPVAASRAGRPLLRRGVVSAGPKKKEGSKGPVSASGGPGQISGISPMKHFTEHRLMLKWPNRQVRDFK